MLVELNIPKALAKRLETVAAIVHINPESILKTALTERLDYLEWKEKAIAKGQADLDSGKVVTTSQIRESLAKQRRQRTVIKQTAVRQGGQA
jgi:predicted transcriptional regulator